ncbi:hypothetical protein IWQ62_003870 [Dispira parvispora]|uniref:DUF202 domain-containing protein n=1 Tax=Dispira parvispora TaxID=1520584 RepID=A0A9W8AN13_9FUNG|nr:hypothetical protein IWQ62_003870 [Dispira parvispora]
MVDNVGSNARDHMSNERTFLSWIRTSTSMLTVGVAITQLFRLSKLINMGRSATSDANEDPSASDPSGFQEADAIIGRVMGIGFIVLAGILIVIGCTRYFLTQHHLLHGYYSASRSVIVLVTFAIIAMMVCLVAIVLKSFFVA